MRGLAHLAPAFGRRAVIISSAVITAIAIVNAPAVAWILLCAVIGLTLLEVPVYIWVSTAVLSATVSRLFVATGVVPGVINFVHFPLALGAVFVATTKGTRQRSLAPRIAFGLVSFLFLSFVSWVLNGGELLRPFLSWLVFAEPFLIIYALLRVPSLFGKEKFLWRFALVIGFVQMPLGFWQAAIVGLGDPVQGTFLDMGAGAHVAGGVALIGTLVCVARNLSATAVNRRLTWLLGGLLLFVLPVLADAKQAIFAFLPALILLLFLFCQIRWGTVLLALPVLSFGIAGAFFFYEPLQMVGNWQNTSHGVLGKLDAFSTVFKRASDSPGGVLFGLGPGNSVSRVGLMSLESYAKSSSPVSLLGLRPAPVTQELFNSTKSDWLLDSSSVWSGIASWLGLFGDLGLLGLGLYLWMGWTLWRHLGANHRWEVGVAKAVLIMVGLLGGVYSWLEEPGFTLVAALVVGLGLIASEKDPSSVQNPARTQFVPTVWR